MTGEHCRVNPDTIKEAPEPQPRNPFERETTLAVTPVELRRRDLVREQALIRGLEAQAAHGRPPYSVADFEAGVAAYLDYRLKHDRRGW